MVNMYYEPLKLLKALNDIKKEHEHLFNKNKKALINDNDGKELILKIASLKKEEVAVFAKVLSVQSNKILYLSDYIFHNKYNVDMNNIFKIIRINMSFEIWQYLFSKWQMFYSDNFKIIYLIYDTVDVFKSFTEKNNYVINKDIIGNWIDSVNIEEAVAADIVNYIASTGCDFDQACNAYFLNKNNTLAIKSRAYYYSMCDTKVLLKTGDKKLAETMRNSTTDIQKKIMLNCLLNIPAGKSSEYPEVWSVIYNFCGKPAESKYVDFFKNIDGKYKDIYRLWFSIFELNTTFGSNDERSIFWKKICIENHDKLKLCRFYPHNEAILMQFDNVYVIEFKIISGGAVYIINSDYYEKKIKNKFNNHCINIGELKKYLYNLWGYSSFQMIRHTHQGYWITKVKNSFYKLLDST